MAADVQMTNLRYVPTRKVAVAPANGDGNLDPTHVVAEAKQWCSTMYSVRATAS